MDAKFGVRDRRTTTTYDVDAGMLRWESVTTPTGPRPKARGGHASASCSDGGALFFGGADRSAAVFDELLRVDVGPCDQGASSCAWRKIDVAKRGHVGFPARTGCTMTRVGDALYVFGGQDPKSGAAFNDVLVVDTTTKEWRGRGTVWWRGVGVVPNGV